MKKKLSIILLVTILLQSCNVYHKTSVSLDFAYDTLANVKVITTEGDKFRFHYIDMKDSVFYGVNNSKKTPLDTAMISGVYIKNIDKSSLGNVLIFLGVIGLLLGIQLGIEIVNWPG